MPATGSKYAKLIKSIFKAPKGWLFVGLDFNALEAHIDALVTRDEAKLRVYLNKYDSHIYNTVHYWHEKTKDIFLLPESSNSFGFKCIINGQEHFLKEGDEIELPDGTVTTIEQAYNLLSNKKLS